MATFIADLHIHSRFSRATSPQLVPEYLDYWAALKGIKVVGTGDFTHPGWLAELKEKLVPEGNGLFRLKKEAAIAPFLPGNETRFLLTAEISNIYKRDGKVRKVHHVVLAPGFEEAERINSRLRQLGGNLTSDGRPILGLDSRDLLEIVLEASPDNLLIPAHIWTPWFSMLGSRSGFDSPEECFGDLLPHIVAIETGLSTDAPMNWLCSFLDNMALVSNSDAHSPDRLGRNANLFSSELSYHGIVGALRHPGHDGFEGTIDLFPQEGKYYYDGHRKCNLCWNPAETLKNREVCPVCGKPVTVGVMNRVIRLSDREEPQERKLKKPFRSIIPLKELLAEILQTGESSRKVETEYFQLIGKLGAELDILLNVPESSVSAVSPALGEAIRRMRLREVYVREGFDGEYGRITVFAPGEVQQFSAPPSLFGAGKRMAPPKKHPLIAFDLHGIDQLRREAAAAEPEAAYAVAGPAANTTELNAEQQAAVEYDEGPALLLAGPGTGKTKTLTAKIVRLLTSGKALPGQILALTFTGKAALEMRERIEKMVPPEIQARQLTVSTFHAFGYRILKEYHTHFNRKQHFGIIDEPEKRLLVREVAGLTEKEAVRACRLLSDWKQGIVTDDLPEWAEKFDARLAGLNVFDLDDLLALPVKLFRENPEILEAFRYSFPFIFVDEYQDTNPKQYELIRLLAPHHHSNLCVVGDPQQAIYGFRGASVEFIRRFTADYPAARTFRLSTSYRCPQTILDASAQVVGEAGMLTGISSGVKINIVGEATDKSEAEFIAREVVQLLGGISFFSIDSEVASGHGNDHIAGLSEIAVLCRTRQQFDAIGKAFRDHNIPFQQVGEEPFFREPPFRELLDLFSRALLPGLPVVSESTNAGIPPQLPDDLAERILTVPPEQSLQFIRNTFFPKTAFDHNLFLHLLEISRNFQSAEEFLAWIKSGSPSDGFNRRQEAVSLMTLHASKGLEFDCVFIAGCEEGLLPFNLFRKDIDQEEEKRLLYVGMTRAKKLLYLTHARSRKYGNRQLSPGRTPFLDPIEKELFLQVVAEKVQKKEQQTQLKLF